MNNVPSGVRVVGAFYVAIAAFYFAAAADVFCDWFRGPEDLFDLFFYELTGPLAFLTIGFGTIWGLVGVGLWNGKKIAVGGAIVLSALNAIAGVAVAFFHAPLTVLMWPLLHAAVVAYLATSRDVHAATA